MGKRRLSEEDGRKDDCGESSKRLKCKGVHFSHVTIFHFPRRQGFVSVPSSGGTSLGMAKKHDYVEKVELSLMKDDEALDEERKDFAPIPQTTRRSLLKTSGVKRIVKKEDTDCTQLRLSRALCGCRCGNICYPETCECILNGINCQADFGRFPCSCLPNGCQNSNGRRQYDPSVVQKHYFDTFTRVNGLKCVGVEKSQYLHVSSSRET